MDLWFGDSWTIGEELGQHTDTFDLNIFPHAVVGRDNPINAFPTFVSKHRKQPFINFAKSASSIEFSLHELIKFCTSRRDPSEKYTAFLCLTAQIRGFGIDYLTNKHLHYFNNFRKSVAETAIYDSIIAINSFYSICKMYDIECIIIPIFCDLIIPKELEYLILFSDSLLLDKSLVELTFGKPLIESRIYESGETENNLYRRFSLEDWIYPMEMHPNLHGHKKLAYSLIQILENKNT